MAVQVDIISSKFFHQTENGDDFSINTTDFNENFAGINMQKIKCLQQLQISNIDRWDAASGDPDQLPLRLSNPSGTSINIIRDDGGNFLQDGFLLNDDIDFQFFSILVGQVTYASGVVTFLNSGEMTISFSGSSPIGGSITVVQLVVTTRLKSLVYSFGLVENGGNFDIKNISTNEDQTWYSVSEIGAGATRSTAFINMDSSGIPKSWVSGSARVRYVSGTAKQIFEIEHIFVIPYFEVGGIEDLENSVYPDYLLGNATLKYVYKADFRTSLSNPNTSKIITVDNRLGSIGYFGETFNGFNSNYELSSVNYQEYATLSNSDGVLIGAKTKVTVIVTKKVGNFNANDFAKIYFSYLPELQSEIENTVTDFETNFMYDNIRTEMGAAATTGTGILSDCSSYSTGNTAVITFSTSLTTAQQLRVDNTNKYIIGIEVRDRTLTSEFSDAVILKTVNLFDDSPDISGLVVLTAKNYPYTEAQSTSLGFSDFVGYNEHGLAIKGGFILNLTQKAFLNNFKAMLVAHNPTTNSYFVLDEYEYQLPQIVSGGIQQLAMSTTRSYQLASGSEKNLIEIGLVSSSSTAATYSFNFAQKIRWENWIENLDVSTLFYDNSEPFDNFNHKTSNYSNLNGYEIKMLYLLNVSGETPLGVAGTTDYRFFSPKFTIYDYDLDGNSTPAFTQVIETFEPTTMTNLGGAVLVGQDTLFRITWTWSGGALTSVVPYWVIHRIEQSNALGQQIMEFGSDETNETTNNLLKTPLTKTLVGGLMVTECLIDGSKTQNIDYNLSGEINSPKSTGTPDDKGTSKILEDSTPKILEGGENKTLET